MRIRRILPLLACVWTVATVAYGASPSVESVSPGVGQRGTGFPLKLVGAGLADAAEVLLYSPGVKCESLQPASDNELSIQLMAAADCPLGTHAFRVRTTKGISELRTFRVTPFPVVASAEPNETVAEAQPLSANTTVTGVLESGDVDCYKISLQRGDRLEAEVEAVRLGGSLLDTVLTILGPDGKSIVTVDDTPLFRQDPCLTFLAPADGDYVVQVRETNFEGDENSRYALHLGTFPRPAFVYPAGGPAGHKIRVRFGGDAAGAWQEDILAPRTPDGDFPLFAAQRGLGSPTRNLFRVSPFDNKLEAEPNDDPADIRGSATSLPIAFNGILERAGDVDCFRFELPAGAAFQFEAFSARLGAPVDTVLSILDQRGNVLVLCDDDETHDSRFTFAAREAGPYVLRVADKRGSGGENCVYRVEASPAQPRLAAFLPRPNRLSQERQALAVPQGNRVLAMLAVQRSGVGGDVALRIEGLPAGVTASEASIPPDRYAMPVVLEAGPAVPLSVALANVLASGRAGDQPVKGHFLQVVDLVAGSADALFHSTSVDRLAVAVVEQVPFRISLDEPKAALAPDGTIGLRVQVQREGDFEGPVEVSFPFLPAWIDGPSKITIPADQTSAIYPARAFPQAEPRTWQLGAEARPGVAVAASAPADAMPGAPRYRRRSRPSAALDVAVSSQLVPLRISEAPVTGRFVAVAAEPGQTVKLVCELNRTGELPETLTATLEGLPNRVAAAPVAISRGERRVSFAVKLESTAPLGTFRDLVCRLSGVIDGQEVSYCVGRGGALKIAPAGTLVTDEAGRPLSPLEALRRSQPAAAGKP